MEDLKKMKKLTHNDWYDGAWKMLNIPLAIMTAQ